MTQEIIEIIHCLQNQTLNDHEQKAEQLLSGGVLSVMSNPAKLKELVIDIVSDFKKRDALYLAVIIKLNEQLQQKKG